MANTDPKTCPLARVLFARDLVKPGKKVNRRTKQEEDYFDAAFGWPKTDDLSLLRNMVVEAAVAEWGEKARDMLKNGVIKSPLLDGDGPQGCNKDTGERKAGHAGHWFARCGTKQRPLVVDRSMKPTDSTDVVYSGAYAYPVLNAYTWENAEQGKGVSFGLAAVQFVKDGERLFSGGGVTDPSKFFESIPDEGGAPAAAKEGQGAAALFS